MAAKGLTQTSSIVAVGFKAREAIPNTFIQAQSDLNLSPLDREVFVCLAIDMTPYPPDALAGTDTKVAASFSVTSRDTVGDLDENNVLAITESHIKAAGFLDSGVGFQTAGMETPPANLPYIGIIATSDFFVQVKGSGNLGTKGVSGKLYGYRARASSDIFAALVQGQALSS